MKFDINRNCVNCDHFAWWDGDYCCVKKLKILQQSKNGEFNNDIIKSLEYYKDCSDWEEMYLPAQIYVEPFKEYLKNINYY